MLINETTASQLIVDFLKQLSSHLKHLQWAIATALLKISSLALWVWLWIGQYVRKYFVKKKTDSICTLLHTHTHTLSDFTGNKTRAFATTFFLLCRRGALYLYIGFLAMEVAPRRRLSSNCSRKCDCVALLKKFC